MTKLSPEMSPQSALQGNEGYVRYLSGVAFLHDPKNTQEIHRQPYQENKELFVVQAEALMLDGAKQVIKAANGEVGQNRIANLEEKYDEALGNMQAIVDGVFILHREREDLLLPAVRYFRPAAFLKENIYKYICHGRLGKIATGQMMDGVFPSSELLGVVSDRKLARSA